MRPVLHTVLVLLLGLVGGAGFLMSLAVAALLWTYALQLTDGWPLLTALWLLVPVGFIALPFAVTGWYARQPGAETAVWAVSMAFAVVGAVVLLGFAGCLLVIMVESGVAARWIALVALIAAAILALLARVSWDCSREACRGSRARLVV